MPHSNLHTQKRRTNRAILIALAAWCVLLFVLTLIKMSPATGDNEEKLTYDVPIKYQSCSVDADCVLVSTGCNQCCQRGAVQANSVLIFAKERDLNCKGYRGGVCDCMEQPATASCVAGRCALVVIPKPSVKAP